MQTDFTTLEKLLDYREKSRLAYNRHFRQRQNVHNGGLTCWRPMHSRDRIPIQPNSSGYVQVGVVQPSGAQNKKGNPDGIPCINAYAHQLGWWAGTSFNRRVIRVLRRKVLRGRSMTVSHLCHNPWCFRPSHLSVEPRWVNIYRAGCWLQFGLECKCHRSRAGVDHKYPSCLASPR